MSRSDDHRRKAEDAAQRYKRTCETLSGLAALSDLLRQRQTPAAAQEREARPSMPPDEDWADAATG